MEYTFIHHNSGKPATSTGVFTTVGHWLKTYQFATLPYIFFLGLTYMSDQDRMYTVVLTRHLNFVEWNGGLER